MYSVPQGTEIEIFRKVLAPLQSRSLHPCSHPHCGSRGSSASCTVAAD